MHEAELQSISRVTADQLAVDGTTIRHHGEAFWPYGITGTGSVPADGRASSGDAVDTETDESPRSGAVPAMKRTVQRSLADLHRRYRLDDVRFSSPTPITPGRSSPDTTTDYG